MSEIDESNNDYDDSNSYVSYDDSDGDAYNSNIEEDNPTSTESSQSSDSLSGYSDSQESYGGSGSGGSYVGSVNSDKFHYSSCGQASKIKPGNLITFSSREEAISRGYSPCKFCNP